jgi:hypothetical protein
MRRLLVGLLLVVAASGCGGDDDPPRPQPPPEPEAVVRGWAADLRRGDIDAATARFAVPSLVSNGTPVERLETRVQVRSFNASLPCGARVRKVRREGRFLVATFVLTERPGGDCGAGTGGTATTAFHVRDGKIVRWIRVPQRGEPPAPSGPVV